jgi:hypothetical protein
MVRVVQGLQLKLPLLEVHDAEAHTRHWQFHVSPPPQLEPAHVHDLRLAHRNAIFQPI